MESKSRAAPGDHKRRQRTGRPASRTDLRDVPPAGNESPNDTMQRKAAIAKRRATGPRKHSAKQVSDGNNDEKEMGFGIPPPSELLESPPAVRLGSPSPGSVAVRGPGSDTYPRTEDTTTTQHQDDPVNMAERGDAAEIIEAELVDPSEREKERNRIRNETLTEVRANSTVAEVVDEEAEKKKRRRLFGTFMLLTCASIAAAVVVIIVFTTRDSSPTIVQIPTLAPTSRYDVIEENIEDLFGEGTLDDPESPEYEAANWMTVNDTTLEFPLQSDLERSKFRQRYAMCVLSFATNIEDWFNNARWLDPIDECRWSGLTCDENGLLVGMSLVDINLNGTLPSQFGVLTDLRYMFVHENPSLGGTLPGALGNMTSLVSFYGNNNNFDGSIPAQFGQLRSLEDLNLSGNQLSGALPVSLSLMIELVELDLSFNNLGDSIPFQVWRLQQLETLLLQDNKLNGTIATDIGAMVQLERVDLRDNLLEGPIPTHMGNLVKLQSFQASGNMLTGSVPEDLCVLRNDPPFAGLQVLETDCESGVNCTCCTQCF